MCEASSPQEMPKAGIVTGSLFPSSIPSRAPESLHDSSLLSLEPPSLGEEELAPLGYQRSSPHWTHARNLINYLQDQPKTSGCFQLSHLLAPSLATQTSCITPPPTKNTEILCYFVLPNI